MSEASLPEVLEQRKGDIAEKFVAIYIAILAVLLAVNAVGGGNASKTIMSTGIEINDTWSFYQAKNVRQTVYRVAADFSGIFATDPHFSDSTRTAFQEKAKAYHSKVEEYESEPQSGEGKKELAAKAGKFDAERKIALQQDPYFDYSGALLQIAIVLASASLLLGGRILLYASYGIGGIGLILLANAFLLLFRVPFLG
jgi:hypothetical protein